MDSKFVRAGLLIITLFAATVLLVVLGINGKLGADGKSGNLSENGSVNTEANTSQGEETGEAVYAEDGRLLNVDVSAWMYDETFFDEYKIGDGKYEVTEEKYALVNVSSIDHDLRIVVMNEEGDLISGRKFTATIAELGNYSDIDRDGIIYVEDVKPGDYQVKVGSVLGYVTPETPVNISVKAKIEYKAVADISYLIKTEADIDAALEDSASNDADEESSGSSAIRTMEGAVFGIDVSKYNGDIDWNKLKEQGVKFAIIRCGYRGSVTGAIVEDPYYRKNIEGAQAAGIPVGLYFFTQATNEREAIEESSAAMSLAGDYDITYPIFVDSESAGGKGRADELDVVERSRALQAFCETIRSGGYNAGIYASKNWFNNRLDISKLSADNITWLAEYADKPSYGASYQMWQYSSAGRIPGIEGRVDMNMSYLDVSDNDKKSTKETESEDKNKNKEKDEDGKVNGRDM